MRGEHKEADRVALQDGPWGTTIARWHKEGLPENVGQLARIAPQGFIAFEPPQPP